MIRPLLELPVGGAGTPLPAAARRAAPPTPYPPAPGSLSRGAVAAARQPFREPSPRSHLREAVDSLTEADRLCSDSSRRWLRFVAVVSGLGVLLAAVGRAEPRPPIVLWPEGAPGALGVAAQDVPTLTPYPADPARASGAAMVVCPGGGYGGLASHEGPDYALWLNEQGITAFVLKYRLGSQGYRHPAMLQDAARAVRWVRANAPDWKVDVHRVGIMGSSAGGHLASTLLTHFDPGRPDAADPVERQSSRPDLGILCYPVITLGEFTHGGSKRNLLGDSPPPDLVEFLSNEKQVTRETPPCFLWHTVEDPVVPVENSLHFAAALRRAGVPFDLHLYERGPHGIGLGTKPPFANPHPWVADCRFWLKNRGFIR